MEPFILTTKGVRFFTDHYMRVRSARKERGLLLMEQCFRPGNGLVADHPMVGRRYEIGGDLFEVHEVYEQWHLGWYTRMFSWVNGTRSHAEHILDASGSQCWTFIDGAEQFARKARFIPEDATSLDVP